MNIEPIAIIHTDFSEKFGIPRQSGLNRLKSTLVFCPDYRDENAVRGIEEYSHLWLIWGFSAVRQEGWSPTVRPPKLGGNVRMGVFATRSPFRPNRLGLSCVQLDFVERTEEGAVLHLSGADLLDGTPVYDVKPYIPYTDAHPTARGGFAVPFDRSLKVVCEEKWLTVLPEAKREGLLSVLEQDPRPAYQSDPERIYGFPFAGYEVKFHVAGEILTVDSVEKASDR